MGHRILQTVVPLALVALLAGCLVGDDETASPVDKAQLVMYLGDKGKSQRAGLSRLPGGKTRIVVDIEKPPKPVMRVELRRGTCGEMVFGAVDYLLEDLVNGRSQSVIDVSLRELSRFSYMIVVRPPSDVNTALGGICGDIRQAAPRE